jgi:hypothetical protein
MFPASPDMRLLLYLRAMTAFKCHIEIVGVAFDDIPDPVFTRPVPLKKLKKIHIFTAFNFIP